MISTSLPSAAQLLAERLGGLGREEVVVARIVAEDRGRQLAVVRLRIRPGDDAVTRHHGGHGIGALGGQDQRQPPSHAKADDADLVAGAPPDQLVDRATHVLGRPLHPERHHGLARLVGLGHRDPVIEVGGQRHEPGGGEAIADVADMVDQAPPLLNHDDPGAGAGLRGGQIADRSGSVAWKFDHLTHANRR